MKPAVLVSSVALLALLAIARPAAAVQALADVAAARTLAESAMQHIGEGRIEEGVALLRPHWLLPDPAAVPAFVQQATAMLAKAEPVYGKPAGWEVLHERRVGDTMLRLGYLQRFQNYGVAWDLHLYRSPEGWLLRQVTYDDTLDPLFVPTDCARAVPRAAEPAGEPVPREYERPEAARDMLDAAMAANARNDTAGAIRWLQAFRGNMSRFQELFTRWQSERSTTVHGDSQSLGVERVLEERVARSVVRYTYLHAFHRDAVRWTATLYRRPSGWNLVNFGYSTDMDPLFDAPACATTR